MTSATALAAAALVLTACTGNMTVTTADLSGHTWPFKTDSATIHCQKSFGHITVDADSTTYEVYDPTANFDGKEMPSVGTEVDPETGFGVSPFEDLAKERCGMT